MKSFYFLISYRVMNPSGTSFAFGDSLHMVNTGLPEGEGKHNHFDLNVLKEDIIVGNNLRKIFGDDVRIILTSCSELTKGAYDLLSTTETESEKEEPTTGHKPPRESMPIRFDRHQAYSREYRREAP